MAGEMPAQFDLFGFGEETEEFGFVVVEEAGFFGGDFFGGVGGAHAYDWYVVPEAGDEFGEELRFLEDKCRDLVSATDRSAVRALKRRHTFCGPPVSISFEPSSGLGVGTTASLYVSK